MPILSPVLDKPKPGPTSLIYLKSQYGTYLANTFRDIVEEQRVHQAKLAKEAPQQLIDPSASSYSHIIKLDDAVAKGESLFIYLKTEEELLTFKNTLLAKSPIGKSFYDDPKVKQTLNAAINLRRGRYLQSFFEIAQRRANGFQVPKKQAVFSKSVARSVDHAKLRAILRRLAITTVIERELLKASEDDYKREKNLRMKKIQDFFKNFAFKKAKFERRKIINCMKKKIPASDLYLFADAQPDNTDYGVLNPKAYFEINTSGVIEKTDEPERVSHLFKVYLLLTNEIYSKDVLPYYFSQELDLTPVPGYSSLTPTEFRVSNFSVQGISLFKQPFEYLLVYKVDSSSKEIVAIGHERIPTSKLMTLEITLKPVRSANRSGSYGKLVLSNAAFNVDSEGLSKPVSSMFAATNFSYLKKLYSLKYADPCLSRLLGTFGLKKQYTIIKNAILQSYLVEKALAENSRVSHDLFETEKFVKYLQRSIITYNSKVVNDAALSLQVLPPVSEMISTRGAIVHTKNYFLQLLTAVGFSLEKLNLPESPNDYLFFGRYQWHQCKDLESQREPLLKAMVTGMPRALYLHVWKSLGKVSLIRLLIKQIILARFGDKSTENSRDDYTFLVEQAKKVNLEEHQDFKRAFNMLRTSSTASRTKEQNTTLLVQLYLTLSTIMEEYEATYSEEDLAKSNENTYKGPLLAGLMLRKTSSIVYLADKLSSMYEDHKIQIVKLKDIDKDLHLKDYSPVDESDLFFLLVSICVVFLPEHFLMPLPNYPANSKAQLVYLDKLGLDLDHVFENRMFVSSSAIGDYKLAVLLAECVRKSDHTLYDKMTTLGFPFASFALEATENLFCELFNDVVLCKVWNLMFFEGSANFKRRGQQVMLSTLVCLVKRCKDLILDSQSSQEITWHLKNYGQLTFESSEFVSDLIKIQRELFVQHNEIQVVTWLEDIVSLDPRLETTLQKIKQQMSELFDSVAVCNYSYLRMVSEFARGLPPDQQLPCLQRAAKSLAGLLLEAEIHQNKVGAKTVQSLIMPLDDMEYTLTKKPQPQLLVVSITHFYAGSFLTTASSLTLKSTVSNQQVNFILDSVPFLNAAFA